MPGQSDDDDDDDGSCPECPYGYRRDIKGVSSGLTCEECNWCGDGRIDERILENCDDGNRLKGDGCSDYCLEEFYGPLGQARWVAVTDSKTDDESIKPFNLGVVLDRTGSVYTTSVISLGNENRQFTLHALDSASGAMRWDVAANGLAEMPLVDDQNRIYWSCLDGLQVFNPEGGAEWRRPIAESERTARSDLLNMGDSNRVFACGTRYNAEKRMQEGAVFAYSTEGGSLLWKQNVGTGSYGCTSIMSDEGRVYVYDSYWLFTLDYVSGDIVFKKRLENFRPIGVVKSGTLLFDSYQAVMSYSPMTDTVNWELGLGQLSQAGGIWPVDPRHAIWLAKLGGGILEPGMFGYTLARPHEFISLDWHSGQLSGIGGTSTEGDFAFAAGVWGEDNTFYFLDQWLVAADGTTGQKKWEFPYPGKSVLLPVIGPDGTVYLAADEKVYAIEGPD